MTGERVARTYRFGPFQIDTSKRILQRGDEILPLTPKAFETLLILIQNSERVVSKDELMERLWSDTYVGETTLAQNIFTLRKTLGESQNNPQYIQTIPRRGYRFIAKVSEVGAQATEQPDEAAAETRHRKEGQAGPADKAYKTIAILPLLNMNSDPDLDYLSEGISETIIYGLSQMPNLRVIARSIAFRYEGREIDPQQVGHELNVRKVLTGRFFQRGNRLIIKVELIEVENGWQLWGQQYDRDLSDLLVVEEDIARHITEALHLTFDGKTTQTLIKTYSANSDAHQLYLKGHYYFNKQTEEGCLRAIEFFEKAIQVDDRYAPAYSGLADALIALDFYAEYPSWELMPKARAAAIKAVEIDGSFAEGYNSLACVKMIYDYDWAGAEKDFKRSIELKSNYPLVHSWYSLYLLAVGRKEESYAECKLALELDPLDVEINRHLGWYYLYARESDKAIEQLKKTLTLDPNCYLARILLGRAYEQQGNPEAAIAEFKRVNLLERTPLLLGFLGHAYALKGETDKAKETLQELETLSHKRYVSPYCMGLVELGLNERDQAFNSLQRAIEIRSEWMIYAKVNPVLDGLRSSPRFAELLRRLKLKP